MRRGISLIKPTNLRTHASANSLAGAHHVLAAACCMYHSRYFPVRVAYRFILDGQRCADDHSISGGRFNDAVSELSCDTLPGSPVGF